MAAQLNTMPREAVEYVHPLPPVPGAISVMRRRARAVLADWYLSPDVAEDAILVISELLTNAILHALPPATLRLSLVRVDGLSALRVEVTDAGPALPAARSAVGVDPDEKGRGQGIVQALAARYGIRVHSEGVIRWADLVIAGESQLPHQPGSSPAASSFASSTSPAGSATSSLSERRQHPRRPAGMHRR